MALLPEEEQLMGMLDQERMEMDSALAAQAPVGS